MFKFLESKFKSFVKGFGKAVRDIRDWFYDTAPVKVFEFTTLLLGNAPALFAIYMALTVSPLTIIGMLIASTTAEFSLLAMIPALMLVYGSSYYLLDIAANAILCKLPCFIAQAYVHVLASRFDAVDLSDLMEIVLVVKYKGLDGLKLARRKYFELKEKAQQAKEQTFEKPVFQPLQLELVA